MKIGMLELRSLRSAISKEDKDYWKYFIKITGRFTAGIHKRYHNSLVGDSPEMARALDSYGFVDLMVSMTFHVALTYRLPRDNPRKFQMGTPTEVMRCMKRCWEMEPTPERVIQDIEGWEYALDKLIAANGTVVHGLALRHGHRAIRADGKGLCTARVTARQRKDSFRGRPVHPDALFSLHQMIDVDDQTNLVRIIQNAENNVQNELVTAFADSEIHENDDVDALVGP
jgi:hypothetical protein